MSGQQWLALHSPGFAQTDGLPVPPYKCIPAGFDAVFQVRSDVLEALLAASVPYMSQDLPYAALVLPAKAARKITDALSMFEIQSSTSLASAALAEKLGIEPSYAASALRVSLHSPTIRPTDPKKIDAEVRWPVSIDLVVDRRRDVGILKSAIEKAFGPHAGEKPAEPPPGVSDLLGAMTSSQSVVKIATGEAITPASIVAVPDAQTCEVHADMTFLSQGPGIAACDEIFAELLQGKMTQAQSLASIVSSMLSPVVNGPPRRITPQCSPFGALKAGERPPAFARFAAQQISTAGNDATHWVLHLCVNVRPPGSDGDRSLVRPFVKDANFAFFLSDEIIASSLACRWARGELPMDIVGDIPIYDTAHGTPGKYVGRARVRVTLKALDGIALTASTAPEGDCIRMTGEQRITMMGLWNHEDEALAFESLGGTEWEGIDRPVNERFALDVLPFSDTGVDLSHQGTAFLHLQLGPPLLEPFYRPMRDATPLGDVTGHLSAACRGAFVRATLDVATLGIRALLGQLSLTGGGS